jgi:hypothetical protein
LGTRGDRSVRRSVRTLFRRTRVCGNERTRIFCRPFQRRRRNSDPANGFSPNAGLRSQR